jgi:hypothetical protein
MSDVKPTTDFSLPDRLYGEHYPDSFIDMPQPILTSRYQPVDDNDKHVREERQQPNEPILTGQSVGSSSASSTAASTPSGTTAASPGGSTTTDSQCRNSADSDQDGFSDNLEYTHITGTTPKGEDAVSGWPCVVVGDICEARVSAAEHVLRTTASQWNTEQHIDAGRDYDGFIKANGI